MPEQKAHLLLVEDETPLRLALADLLADAGFHVVQAHAGEEAVAALSQFAFDVVLTDLRLPGIAGTGVLDAALDRYPDILVVVMTGYGTVRDAVALIKRGAADLITKPFQSEELLHVLHGALEQRRLRNENAYLRSQLQARYRFEGIIGQSRVVRELFGVLETVASTASTILVTGETGTGKELVARAIHHNSPRRDQRFVAINCSALPETLLEAELFGHVRGAFTGAIGPRVGRFEQAHKGTLFLDEIGTMSANLQAKLLRVLQEREFERLGGHETLKSDVRLIAATNKDLERAIEQGKFREDLFYRLNVFPIFIPPLRERKPDVLLLADHFLQRFSAEHGRDIRRLATPAIDMLTSYHWPGNARELQNVIERAVLVCDGHVIHAHHLSPTLQTAEASGTVMSIALDDAVAAYEKDLLQDALKSARGNRAKAARLLRTTERIVNYKVRKLGIDWKRFKG